MMKKPLILVVDDDDSILNLTTLILQKHGFEVVTALSPAHAVGILHLKKPDLLITDLMMEPVDGFDFLSTEFGGTPPIPVIMLSSVNNERAFSRASTLGVSDYILKPFRPDTLVAKVKSLLP